MLILHLLRQLVLLILIVVGMELAINFNFTVGILISAGCLLAFAVPVIDENLEIIERKNNNRRFYE